jgi:hypothetical protein
MLFNLGVWLIIFVLVVALGSLQSPDDIEMKSQTEEGFDSDFVRSSNNTSSGRPWRIWWPGFPHWQWKPFYRYYYYDPWWAHKYPYNRVCDAFARRSCQDSWYPRACFRRHYNNCVSGAMRA